MTSKVEKKPEGSGLFGTSAPPNSSGGLFNNTTLSSDKGNTSLNFLQSKGAENSSLFTNKPKVETSLPPSSSQTMPEPAATPPSQPPPSNPYLKPQAHANNPFINNKNTSGLQFSSKNNMLNSETRLSEASSSHHFLNNDSTSLFNNMKPQAPAPEQKPTGFAQFQGGPPQTQSGPK